MDSQNVPNERIRIFDRQGYEVASFMAAVSRSWAIGREGRAEFQYPAIKTNVVNERVLQFGNYLLIENSALPAWIGIIDTPRSWNFKNVFVSAYTPERLFSYRRGSKSEEVITGSAGTIFEKMVQKINAAEKTVMMANSIWRGGVQRQETLNPNTMEVNLRQLQERSLEEYEFIPTMYNNKLVILANWYQSLGVDTPLSLTQAADGGNLGESTMKEDGEITNDVYGYGEGMTWGTKPTQTTINTESIAKYGLRQEDAGWRGVTNLSTISQNNLDLLKNTKQPKKIFQLSALNIGDTFKYLRLGNRVTVLLKNIGFSFSANNTKVVTRILGMSYSPNKGKNIVSLVAKDV